MAAMTRRSSLDKICHRYNAKIGGMFHRREASAFPQPPICPVAKRAYQLIKHSYTDTIIQTQQRQTALAYHSRELAFESEHG